MTRFTITLIGLIALLGMLALVPVTAASAGTPGGPRTWHVLVGGQSEDQAVQAEGYYPHVITIDAGDTVTWTLNTTELHGVSVPGTCPDISLPCFPPDCLPPNNFDISPCGPSSFDGVVGLANSGRMLAPVYDNWDNAFTNGGTTYSLTFTQPGATVYFDPSVSGMRGVVIVHPAGTPYPFTQAQYSAQAQQQLRSDLAVGAQARGDAPHVTSSAGPGGTRIYHVALGASPPQKARAVLGPAPGSPARGSAVLDEPGAGTSLNPSITVRVRLSGLAPGSVHAVQILPGACGAPAPQAGYLISLLFNPPAFTLNNVTAGPDGTATGTTVITVPPNLSGGPGLLRIPSAGWFINVAAGAAADNDATSAACGNVVSHSATVMRYFPQNIHIHVGDTVVWADNTSNELHGVTFLAGQPLPQIPDWYGASPTGNGVSYDGSSFFNSGPLYPPDAYRTTSLTLTFTKAGTFPYVDVPDFFMGMQGSVTVTPP
jgi:plastocyanin